jgi:hypothetical protein
MTISINEKAQSFIREGLGIFSGSRSRTRTCGMVVNSHPLYQLSYPGIIGF